VTNDDGVSSPGLHHLAVALGHAGHDVVIVAPAQDCSGFGAAIGPLHLTGQVEFEQMHFEEVANPAFAVDGPPALCVLAAALGGFGPRPELVVSGINAGANTGRAVLHSGTVGAALTALNFGIPGLAVSQVGGDDPEWASAAALATEIAARTAELRPPIVLNLNVPNLPLGEIGGVFAATLDPGGTVQAAMVERQAGVLELHIPERSAPRDGTDTALLAAGRATITALAGPHALGLDMAQFRHTANEAIARDISRERVPA
jgi:5'-nucleotidase